MSNTIEHKGKIVEIRKDSIDVLIVQNSACAGCHAKKACSAADMSEKIIEVSYWNKDLRLNDEVTVVGSTTMGWMAVGYAFALPFVLLMIILILFTSIGNNELVAGLAALSILVPYYIILFLFRHKIKKNFTFILKR